MGNCKMTVVIVVVLAILVQVCHSEPALRGPPKVEGKPMLLDSFIPASMQIMAHLTELMKYDLKPTTAPPFGLGPTSTSTIRPTPSHRPGIYAPAKPPGPEAYFAQKEGSSYKEYVQRLQQPSGMNYFDRYRYPFISEQEQRQYSRDSQSRSYQNNEVPPKFDLYFGKDFSNVLRLVNRVEPEFVLKDIDDQAQEFSKDYDDDSEFRFELLRQKKVPPTRAYVTLLSLYDAMNKESKRLGLNKYHGYSDSVLRELVQSATGTSAYQLRTVLGKIVERQDTKKPDILKKIKQLLADLDESGNYINVALRFIPPLPFVL